MNNTREPDYTRCSLEELIEVQERIDREAHPERAAALDLEIARRMRARPTADADGPGRFGSSGGGTGTTGIRLDDPIAFKPGRAMSVKRAVGAIAGLILGLALIVWGTVNWEKDGFLILAFGIVFVLTSATDVAYHLFNAFNRRRFSDQDMLTRSQEPDPLSRSLGFEAGVTGGQGEPPRRFPGQYCPFCGARAPDDADRCPGCGKDI